MTRNDSLSAESGTLNLPQSEPTYVGKISVGEKTMTVEAETPELLIAKVHDAMQGIGQTENQAEVHIELARTPHGFQKKVLQNLRRRTGRVKVGGGATQFVEDQEKRKYAEGTVLMDCPLIPTRISNSLKTRFRLMRLFQTGEETPPVNGDDHFERVQMASHSGQIPRRTFDILVHQYNQQPLNAEISDALVRRLCAAMTACGLETEESCEGHGNELPKIWFTCTKSRLKMLRSALKHLRETWEVDQSGASRVHPEKQLYVLCPKDDFCSTSKAAERYPRAIADLDTLGLTLLMHRKSTSAGPQGEAQA
ncbi:MAG: hypothetical protein V1926_02990 [Candidatus Peregrinibacteria bacterium]